MIGSSIVVIVGFGWALKNYRVPENRQPGKISPDLIRSVLEKKYFIDYFYENVVGRMTMGIAYLCHKFDRAVVNELMVNETARKTYQAGEQISKLQSGNFQDYVFWGLLVSLGAMVWILK
jgi:NADH:ubiquinone oxidoreductase subunit 5 (subunit L)/multisubunit Na+/H+ antiporter MnhA subunit